MILTLRSMQHSPDLLCRPQSLVVGVSDHLLLLDPRPVLRLLNEPVRTRWPLGRLVHVRSSSFLRYKTRFLGGQGCVHRGVLPSRRSGTLDRSTDPGRVGLPLLDPCLNEAQTAYATR